MKVTNIIFKCKHNYLYVTYTMLTFVFAPLQRIFKVPSLQNRAEFAYFSANSLLIVKFASDDFGVCAWSQSQKQYHPTAYQAK